MKALNTLIYVLGWLSLLIILLSLIGAIVKSAFNIVIYIILGLLALMLFCWILTKVLEYINKKR